MWPSSTRQVCETGFRSVLFQSLKRDVAFFHLQKRANARYRERVSIAQARCGLLPLAVYQGHKKLEWRVFESLKRDVAFFHLSMMVASRRRVDVSIAQARCGLLPLNDFR